VRPGPSKAWHQTKNLGDHDGCVVCQVRPLGKCRKLGPLTLGEILAEFQNASGKVSEWTIRRFQKRSPKPKVPRKPRPENQMRFW